MMLGIPHKEKVKIFFSVFKAFKVERKLEIGKKIKCLRTDNGGEFCSQEFDVPRCWYKRFDSFIFSLGCNRLSSNHCVYYKRFDGDDFIILLLYVDDMLVASPNKD